MTASSWTRSGSKHATLKHPAVCLLQLLPAVPLTVPVPVAMLPVRLCEDSPEVSSIRHHQLASPEPQSGDWSTPVETEDTEETPACSVIENPPTPHLTVSCYGPGWAGCQMD